MNSVLTVGDDQERERGAFVNLLKILPDPAPDAIEGDNANVNETSSDDEADDDDEGSDDRRSPSNPGEDDPKEGEYPPIEGLTDYDVGWVRIDADVAIPHMYLVLENPAEWRMMYVRPPRVMHP